MPGTTRREFLRYGSAGLAAFGGWSYLLALGQFVGTQILGFFGGFARLPPRPKPWELEYGVVDYDLVKKVSYGPPELGFQNDIRTSPPDARVLNVAQWYDYWPGRVVQEFTDWMQRTWNVADVKVNWTSNIYTSNEELYAWIASQGRQFDLMVPTNHMVERMEKEGFLVNLNKDWIPNYANLFGPVPSPVPDPRPTLTYQPTYPAYPNGYNNWAGADFRTPALNGYAYRMVAETYPTPRGTAHYVWDEENSLLAVPYQWGTTGIGYRSDVFRPQDIEDLGWDVFGLREYVNPDTGQTHGLQSKMMMLDDMREAFTAGFKAAGWKRQVDAGLTPTAIPQVKDPPYNGEYQWSSNEADPGKIAAAADWLASVRVNLWGFNTTQQGPFLVSATMFVDQAWSGDVMYAVRPASNLQLPVDYFVPKQGSTRWVDNLVIHRECEKLWLAHEFINYLHEPDVQATISAWNLYATPNAWTFELMHNDPRHTFLGQNTDGSLYQWNPTEDSRIYADLAFGYAGPPILNRCEYHKDLGPTTRRSYEFFWQQLRR